MSSSKLPLCLTVLCVLAVVGLASCYVLREASHEAQTVERLYRPPRVDPANLGRNKRDALTDIIVQLIPVKDIPDFIQRMDSAGRENWVRSILDKFSDSKHNRNSLLVFNLEEPFREDLETVSTRDVTAYGLNWRIFEIKCGSFTNLGMAGWKNWGMTGSNYKKDGYNVRFMHPNCANPQYRS